MLARLWLHPSNRRASKASRSAVQLRGVERGEKDSWLLCVFVRLCVRIRIGRRIFSCSTRFRSFGSVRFGCYNLLFGPQSQSQARIRIQAPTLSRSRSNSCPLTGSRVVVDFSAFLLALRSPPSSRGSILDLRLTSRLVCVCRRLSKQS